MENALPAPPSDYGYLVTILVAFLSLGTLVIAFGVREYLKYRDRREAEDKVFREQQLADQKQHWKEETEARSNFRAAFEQNTNDRFAELERDARDFNDKLRAIIDTQQTQIHSLGKELDRLSWELGIKKPPKEGV